MILIPREAMLILMGGVLLVLFAILDIRRDMPGRSVLDYVYIVIWTAAIAYVFIAWQ